MPRYKFVLLVQVLNITWMMCKSKTTVFGIKMSGWLCYQLSIPAVNSFIQHWPKAVTYLVLLNVASCVHSFFLLQQNARIILFVSIFVCSYRRWMCNFIVKICNYENAALCIFEFKQHFFLQVTQSTRLGYLSVLALIMAYKWKFKEETLFLFFLLLFYFS